MKGMTKKELATVAGYTYRRLYDIDRDLPKEKKLFVASEDGKYDLAIFVQHWLDYNLQKETADVNDLKMIKAKHEVVKTKKTELEVEKLRGQLIDVEDVRRLWGDVITAVTQNMVHLSSRVSPLLLMQNNTEVISEIIDEEVRRILSDITEVPVPDYAKEDEEAIGNETNGDREPKDTE